MTTQEPSSSVRLDCLIIVAPARRWRLTVECASSRPKLQA